MGSKTWRNGGFETRRIWSSNILQEMMTIKSDDVIGRAKAYESIVKGKSLPPSGVPESFNVLLHELRGLGLKVSFE